MMIIQYLIIMSNFVLDNTVDKNYKKEEDRPLMSLETDSIDIITGGRTMK